MLKASKYKPKIALTNSNRMIANSLLLKADGLDNYQTRCKRDTVNSRAREKCLYIPWHDQSAAEKIKTEIGKPYVDVVIMHPSAEGGMPHTRAKNLICIPVYYPPEKMDSMLEHELIHLEQRNYFDSWKDKLLNDGWLFMDDKEAQKRIPSAYLNRCRFNPDTLYCRFPAWEGRYIPLPMFVREDKPDMKEVVIRWWDLELEKMRLTPAISYTKRYGEVSKSEEEHPFEYYAYKGISLFSK